MDRGAWKAAVHGVAKSRTQLSDFPFTFHYHALEKEMATHSSVLAWRIPGTGEPGGLPSMGSHTVGHDWSDLAAVEAAAAVCYHCVSLSRNFEVWVKQRNKALAENLISGKHSIKSILFLAFIGSVCISVCSCVLSSKLPRDKTAQSTVVFSPAVKPCH